MGVGSSEGSEGSFRNPKLGNALHHLVLDGHGVDESQAFLIGSSHLKLPMAPQMAAQMASRNDLPRYYPLNTIGQILSAVNIIFRILSVTTY